MYLLHRNKHSYISILTCSAMKNIADDGPILVKNIFCRAIFQWVTSKQYVAYFSFEKKKNE